MFWKKKPATGEPSKPKEILINQIEQLAPAQEVGYCVRSWAGDCRQVLFVKLNPQYPKKGQKYVMSRHGLVEGKLAGNRIFAWDSNKPKEVAEWVLGDHFDKGLPEKWEG